MLSRAVLAALLAVALVAAGCGAAEQAVAPDPIERHLVYDRLIGEKGIWIADVDGSNPRRLVRGGGAPELSPDGRSVAYLDDCDESWGRCSIYLVSTSGEGPKLLSRGLYGGASWSAGSDRIVAARLSSEETLEEALVSIDAASGSEVILTDGQLYGWNFSPDGKQIVYAVAHGSNPEGFNGETIDLFVSDSEGGGSKRITDTGDSGYPVWGPKSIAFAKLITCMNPPELRAADDRCPKNAWARHEIWRIQPDGEGRTTITGPTPERFLGQGYMGLIPIDWSDNGRELLAGWLDEWGTSTIAVDPETGKVRDLEGGETVSLSRDGRFALAYTSNNAGVNDEGDASVLIVPYDGGKPKVVARGAVSPSWNR